MNEPKFCRDCKHSIPEPKSEWNIRCKHPAIVGKDAWALSDSVNRGTDCRGERKIVWWLMPCCGQSGKLYEIKEQT
jgi:hypothetical protein